MVKHQTVNLISAQGPCLLLALPRATCRGERAARRTMPLAVKEELHPSGGDGAREPLSALNVGMITLPPEMDPDRQSGWFEASPTNENDGEVAGESAVKREGSDDEQAAAVAQADAACRAAMPEVSNLTVSLIDLTDPQMKVEQLEGGSASGSGVAAA
eukprot:1289006-Pyramimonas_sp.AAC.1